MDHEEFTVGINLSPRDRSLAVLFSGEGKPYPAHKIGPAVHSYYLMHTVLSGEGVFECGGQSLVCREGDTFIIFPGVLFSYEADASQPWHYIWVAFQGEAAHDLMEDLGLTPRQPVIHKTSIRGLAGLYRRIRRSFADSNEPRLQDLEASGWLRLLLHRLGKEGKRIPLGREDLSDIDRQVEQAIRWITLQYHQPISIEGMAQSLGYHRAHLSKAFKQRTGRSPKQYLMQVRLEQAKTLLEGTLTVEQVASAVGFKDALYFSKLFRRWAGLSPTEYRGQNRIKR